MTRFLAKGYFKKGQMNKTEAAYAQRLELLKRAGEIDWFKYEGITMKLAPDTRYTPDFAVINRYGEMEFHEVKGARAIFRDDAKVKVKVASEMFPFKFFVVYPNKQKPSGWDVESYQ